MSDDDQELEDVLGLALGDSGSEYDPSASGSESPVSSDEPQTPSSRLLRKRKKAKEGVVDKEKQKKKRKRMGVLRRRVVARGVVRPGTGTGRAVKKREEAEADSPLVSRPTGSIRYGNFDNLLGDVVFSMSGYVNPLRSQLRSCAVQMGATYRPDWDNSCTHLLCAFTDTPKYHHAKGHGRIVSKEWIQDGYAERKRFPWRRYAVDRRDRGVDESEDEIQEVSSIVVDEDLQANMVDLSEASSEGPPGKGAA